MSCIKRYLEELASQRADEEGIDFIEAMNLILEEANSNTDRKEDVQMKVAYSMIDNHLHEIRRIMKENDIYEFKSNISADDKTIFTAAFKRV